MSKLRIYLCISLLTASTLLLELSMTRLFSVLMFYHFAFMAISIALFGLGASGLFLYLRADKFAKEKFAEKLTMASLLFAMFTVLGMIVAIHQPISTNYSATDVIRLVIIYLASLIPFFFSGLAVSLILYTHATDFSKLYFFDLAGAACGALLTVPLLNAFGAIDTELLAAGLALVSAYLASRSGSSKMRNIAPAALLSLLLVFGLNVKFGWIKLEYVKGVVKQNVEFSGWNAFSYITVQSIPNEPNAKAIDIDADARTYVLKSPFKTFGVEAIRDQLTPGWISHIANVLHDSANVLIIGPGGGMDIVFAKAWGAKSVEAVEINPIIVDDIMRGEYAQFSGGLYFDPAVEVVKGEGRSYVARSSKKYDIIQLTLVDTWAATSAGAFSLSENNLYTVEAFKDYLNHLNDSGTLSLTRWYSDRPKESLRLMTIALKACEETGIKFPEQNIAIIAGKVASGTQLMASFLLKKTPYTESELARLDERVKTTNSTWVYRPFSEGDNPFYQLVHAPNRSDFIANYEFNITPSTDNQPFFFNCIRGVDLKKIMLLDPESRKNNLGIFNLYLVAIISLLVVFLFLVLPLVVSRAPFAIGLPASKSLLYFIFIGLGFILIEISLMQKLILYLGHPVYSLVVVLASILVFAGLGALSTNRFDARTSRKSGAIILSLLLAVIFLIQLLLPSIIRSTFSSSLQTRIAITTLLLAPLGYLMGQPLPLEMKLVELRSHTMIPWVWSLNGAASVLGSVIAVALAMAYGFNTVIAVGMGCYALAFLARGWKVHEEKM